MILESVLYLREKHKWKSKRKFGGTKSDMKLIFIRHAEPDYEKDSLTPKGFREAELLAKRVASWGIKDIYCSPLGRAKATAKPGIFFSRTLKDISITTLKKRLKLWKFFKATNSIFLLVRRF